MLEALRGIFSGRGKEAIMLERVPDHLRQHILNAGPGDFFMAIRWANRNFIEHGQPVLTGLEFREAEDANYRVYNRISRDEGRPSIGNFFKI